MKSIWWNQVTNAVKYVTDIKQCLLDEKSLLIKYSQAVPWREEFEEIVKDGVKLQNAEKKFVCIPTVKDPGEYLLKEFCKKEKRAEYRPSKGYAKFFAENDDIVLHDRYLWIKLGGLEDLENWMKFVSEYLKERGKHDNKAVFILELMSDSLVPNKKGIKMFSLDDYIGEYDRIVFSCLASSEVKDRVLVKDYLAELVSNVAGNDIELCSACIRNFKNFLRAPRECVLEIVRTKTHSDGSDYVYEQDEGTVDRLVWLSQIKTVYPRLEEYREDFVQRHYSAIEKRLPIKASYGEEYTDPKDVELGTLMYMAGCGDISLNYAEYERLRRYKEARNKLSHLTALSFDEVCALI